MEYSVAMTEAASEKMREFLLQDATREEICFATWRPAAGKSRYNVLIGEPIYPGRRERKRGATVSAMPEYVDRCKEAAREQKSGLAMAHTHPFSTGHQGVSPTDLHSEQDLLAREVFGVTGLPFVGMTLAGDGTWSARAYPRPDFRIRWCAAVRTVGKNLRVNFHPDLSPARGPGVKTVRSASVWGPESQADMARLRVGIVGAGSVGAVIAEILARMGVGSLLLMDYDSVKPHNLDRLLGASEGDVGSLKTGVSGRNAARSATLARFSCSTSANSIVEEAGFSEALDCDVLFSCVDRPWPRQVLNHLAYSSLIPVIDGGVSIRVQGGRLVHGMYRAQTVGPHRACLSCLGALEPGTVSADRDGVFDDPGYIRRRGGKDPDPARQNVMPFSVSLAGMESIQFVELVTGIGGAGDLGQQPYDYASGEILPRHCKCLDGCAVQGKVAAGDLCRPFLGTDKSRARDLGDRAAERPATLREAAAGLARRIRSLARVKRSPRRAVQSPVPPA